MGKEGLMVDGVLQYHRMRLETNRLRLMHQADEETSFRISLTTVKSALVEMYIVVESEHVFVHLDLEGGCQADKYDRRGIGKDTHLGFSSLQPSPISRNHKDIAH